MLKLQWIDGKTALLWMVATALVAGCGSKVTVQPGGAGGGSSSAATNPTTSTGSSMNSSSSSGGVDVTSCTTNSECAVVPASCCGSCGAATRGDAIAINKSKEAAHRATVCGDDFGCPSCYQPQDPSLVASCRAGQCMLVDLHQHPSAACKSNADCRLRASACCECGADVTVTGLIAVNAKNGEQDYAPLVCDPMMSCDECAPNYPKDAKAACHPDGHCEVLWSGSSGSDPGN